MIESFFLSLLLNILIAELSPKPKIPGAKRYSLSDFSVPTATEDRSLPLVFGTAKVAGNIIWYGDYRADAITERIRVSLFKKQTVVKGHRYRVGMWLTLCAATCDQINEVRLGEQVVWSGELSLSRTAPTVLDVNKSWTSTEGQEIAEGFAGRFVFFNQRVAAGADYEHNPAAYLDAQLLAGNVPAYPNALHVLWLGPSAQAMEDAIIGGAIDGTVRSLLGFTSLGPSIAPLTFTVRRLPDLSHLPGLAEYVQWGTNAQPSPGDANPAHIALEVLTTSAPGIGPNLGPWAVDIDAFQRAAAVFQEEGHGMSGAWETSRPIGDLLADIGVATNAMLEMRSDDGRLAIKTIRGSDAVKASFSVSNIVEMRSFTRTAVSQAPNRVEVPFVDRKNGWVDRVAYAKNTAAIKLAGSVIDARSEFLWTSNATLAQRLASRELVKVSSALARVSFVGINPDPELVLRPGDLIEVSPPRLGQTLAMRVVSVRFADPQSPNQVDIEAMEDVFRNGYALGGGVSPIAPPVLAGELLPLANAALGPAPYALTGDDADHLLYVGNDPGAGVSTYRLATKESDWQGSAPVEFEDNSQEPAIVGALVAPLSTSEAPSTLQLQVSPEALQQFLRGGRASLYAVIGSPFSPFGAEWFELGDWTYTNTTLTAGYANRAIFDTVPRAHPAGTSVRLLLGYTVLTERVKCTLNPSGPSFVSARAESRGSAGVLDVESAAGSEATWSHSVVQERAMRPLPPGRVLLANTLAVLDDTETAASVPRGQLTLAWTNRSRGLQAGGYFEPIGSSETGAYVAVTLSWETSPGQWFVGPSLLSNVGASSLTVDLAVVPEGARRVRLTLESRRPFGDNEAVSAPVEAFWQLTE